MKKRYLLVFTLAFIIFFTYFMTMDTFSKYQSNIDNNIEPVGTAIPIFENNISEITVPLQIDDPGDTYEYDFYVTNELNSKISDVSLDYDIELDVSTNLPLEYTLYKNNININILDNQLKTETFSLTHSIKTIDNYKLIIYWPIIEDDYRYANLTEQVTIILNAVQKFS